MGSYEQTSMRKLEVCLFILNNEWDEQQVKYWSGCSLVDRILRCGCGDLGSDPNNHIYS